MFPAPDAASALTSSNDGKYIACLAGRRTGQTFRAFCAAHTDDELRTFLAGTEVAPVARDAPAGPVPHGVDG